MVAEDFLQDQQVRQWLDGVESAWMLLAFDSLRALRREPSAPQNAIRFANDLSADEIAGSAVTRNTFILPRQGSAPPGMALRLRGVELVARNLDGFTRDKPSITDELRLRDWDQPAKLAWPPPQTSLGLLVLQGMTAAVDHLGANGWQQRDEHLGKLRR
jgi:hypothetical protein